MGHLQRNRKRRDRPNYFFENGASRHRPEDNET